MRSNLTTAQTKWLPPKHLQQLPHLLHGPQQLDGHLGSHHCLSKRRCIAGCCIGGAGRRAAGAHSSSQALDCTQATLQACSGGAVARRVRERHHPPRLGGRHAKNRRI